MKNLYFVAGLPKSGSTLLINILKQNPNIFTENNSSLCSIINGIFVGWDNLEVNKNFSNLECKKRAIKSIVENYHDTDKKIIFDKDLMWINKIGLLEEVLEKEIKIICAVRNPAEILASFEKDKKQNPLKSLINNTETTIASRCFYYSGPNGELGLTHSLIKDAIISGYLDKLLFVDYNKLCSTPKMQMKRIYDFFELSKFNHDFNNLDQLDGPKELYKETMNCIEYLGLDLYEQYNREIFWDAWV